MKINFNNSISDKKLHSLLSEETPLDKLAEVSEMDADADKNSNRKIIAAPKAKYCDKTLDLHDMTVSDALKSAKIFLKETRKQGYLKCRIITGKGLNSPGGVSKLKLTVYDFLESEKGITVRDFKHASPNKGGSGAYDIRLK